MSGDTRSSNKRVTDQVLTSFIDEYREGCELHLLLSELRDRRAADEPSGDYRDQLYALLIRRGVHTQHEAHEIAFGVQDSSLSTQRVQAEPPTGPLKLDNERQVFFYEQDHYYLSNFSAFCVHFRGRPFFTSEHAYHWARFELPEGRGVLLQDCVQRAASAHEAFKFAQENKSKQRPDWDAVKVDTMREVLRAKVEQHEYVRRKLLQTGDRELIENSWRDPYWGWGENRDGLNVLGKLWMEIRAELRGLPPTKPARMEELNAKYAGRERGDDYGEIDPRRPDETSVAQPPVIPCPDCGHYDKTHCLHPRGWKPAGNMEV